jgi:hypothetical protein
MHPGRGDVEIWTVTTLDDGNLRHLVEEGRDFLLAGPTGETVRVIAAGGHLINSDELVAGDVVSVWGYVDRVADPRGGVAGGRGALAVAVRSGDTLPLLVRRGTEPDAVNPAGVGNSPSRTVR